MKKKFLLTILALSVSLTIITGCQNGTNANGIDNAAQSSANTENLMISDENNDASANLSSEQSGTSETSNTNDSGVNDAGISGDANNQNFSNSQIEPQEFLLANGTSVKFTSYDLDDTYDTSTSTLILCEGNSVNISEAGGSSNSVVVNGNQIVITRGGTYFLQGNLSDGQIYINAGDEDKVHIILSNANITCLNNAPIVAVNADKVILTLASGTSNSVTDGYAYSDDVAKASIYAKCDLSINGSGSLIVTSNHNNGIASKDDIKISGGTIEISAVNNGIKGNDSVSIIGGNITITRCEDGIKSDNDNNSEKGFIYLGGGSISISADDDSLQAESAVMIENCYVYSRCYGKEINCDGTIQGEDIIKEWM